MTKEQENVELKQSIRDLWKREKILCEAAKNVIAIADNFASESGIFLDDTEQLAALRVAVGDSQP